MEIDLFVEELEPFCNQKHKYHSRKALKSCELVQEDDCGKT